LRVGGIAIRPHFFDGVRLQNRLVGMMDLNKENILRRAEFINILMKKNYPSSGKQENNA
jgi:hypothetical protein